MECAQLQSSLSFAQTERKGFENTIATLKEEMAARDREADTRAGTMVRRMRAAQKQISKVAKAAHDQQQFMHTAGLEAQHAITEVSSLEIDKFTSKLNSQITGLLKRLHRIRLILGEKIFDMTQLEPLEEGPSIEFSDQVLMQRLREATSQVDKLVEERHELIELSNCLKTDLSQTKIELERVKAERKGVSLVRNQATQTEVQVLASTTTGGGPRHPLVAEPERYQPPAGQRQQPDTGRLAPAQHPVPSHAPRTAAVAFDIDQGPRRPTTGMSALSQQSLGDVWQILDAHPSWEEEQGATVKLAMRPAAERELETKPDKRDAAVRKLGSRGVRNYSMKPAS
eukprot:m.158203 g.158203  ORF g.158203 m.158203 type:complete len:341 (-) comp52981_c0_seq1:163-1185(-)